MQRSCDCCSVHQAITTIQTGDGKADVAPDQAGFVAASGRTRPRVLERVPGDSSASHRYALVPLQGDRTQVSFTSHSATIPLVLPSIALRW